MARRGRPRHTPETLNRARILLLNEMRVTAVRMLARGEKLTQKSLGKKLDRYVHPQDIRTALNSCARIISPNSKQTGWQWFKAMVEMLRAGPNSFLFDGKPKTGSMDFKWTEWSERARPQEPETTPDAKIKPEW